MFVKLWKRWKIELKKKWPEIKRKCKRKWGESSGNEGNESGNARDKIPLLKNCEQINMLQSFSIFLLLLLINAYNILAKVYVI